MELTLPERIQILRKRSGLNQGECGARAFNLGTDSGRTKIKNIELGKQQPSAGDLKNLATVLDVPLSVLQSSDSTASRRETSEGIWVTPKVLELFANLGPYLEMLNNAVMIDDGELIDHISGKLSEVFNGQTMLRTASSGSR